MVSTNWATSCSRRRKSRRSKRRIRRPSTHSPHRTFYTGRFMSKLLEGKLALILGIANKWSLAYAIAQAFHREGAKLALTYLGERQKEAIEELSRDFDVAAVLPCDVTKEEELAGLTESLRALDRPLNAVVHSLAFANT